MFSVQGRTLFKVQNAINCLGQSLPLIRYMVEAVSDQLYYYFRIELIMYRILRSHFDIVSLDDRKTGLRRFLCHVRLHWTNGKTRVWCYVVMNDLFWYLIQGIGWWKCMLCADTVLLYKTGYIIEVDWTSG